MEVQAVRALQVSRIILKHEDGNNDDPYFFLEARIHHFMAELTTGGKYRMKFERLAMSGFPFPLICSYNNATTEHKIQGCTIQDFRISMPKVC